MLKYMHITNETFVLNLWWSFQNGIQHKVHDCIYLASFPSFLLYMFLDYFDGIQVPFATFASRRPSFLFPPIYAFPKEKVTLNGTYSKLERICSILEQVKSYILDSECFESIKFSNFVNCIILKIFTIYMVSNLVEMSIQERNNTGFCMRF